jgi:LysR family glycine cleavage system transcriptional activator
LDLPSLTGLRAFEAAARHLSFSAAAAELHVTQTAISHQIARLEAQLGLRLFIRRPRALALTAEAQAYLPAVRDAFEGLRRATARLGRERSSGTLTVTAMTSFAAKWLVPRLGAFQALHPDVDVRLTTSMALVDFRRDDVDMGIRLGTGPWPGLRTDFLLAEDWLPVCNPAVAARLASPADLAGETLLHIDQWRGAWDKWVALAGAPGLRGARNLAFDLHLTALQAAMDGAGVALGPSPLVEADLAAGRLVAPFTPRLHLDGGYFIVTPEEAADRPKIRAFRDWLLAQVRVSGHPQTAPATTVHFTDFGPAGGRTR